MFYLEGGFRLLGIKISERAPKQFWCVRRHRTSATFCKVGFFEVGKRFGTANRRTKTGVAGQVIVDPLTSDPGGWEACIKFFGFDEVYIVSLLQVVQRKPPARKKFVEEPQTPYVLAGRFGADVFEDLLFLERSKQNGEKGQIRPVVLKSEFKMIAWSLSRPVRGRIGLFDEAVARAHPMRSASATNDMCQLGTTSSRYFSIRAAYPADAHCDRFILFANMAASGKTCISL